MAPRKRPRKRRVNYRRYIQSAKWFRFRDSYFKAVPEACAICASKEHINLHHMTYERLGRERFEDMMPLCRSHHDRLHKAYDAKCKEVGRKVNLHAFSIAYAKTYKAKKKS